MRALCLTGALLVTLLVASGTSAQGVSQASTVSQTPTARMAVTFRQAVDLAIQRNPSTQQAAADILRAQALLRQVTSTLLPNVSGDATTTTLNEARGFAGGVTTPRNQLVASLTVSELLFAPVQWALRAQSMENVRVVESAAADVRRQVGLAAAQAYLAVIARRRVLDAEVRARDVARAHYELARQQRELGSGSLLNELRAQQSLSSDEVLVEQAAFDVARAEEALGVLLAQDGPVTTADEPTLEVPADLAAATSHLFDLRSDVRLAAARQQAAARVVRDSWKDWLPSVTGLFQPQYLTPSTLFQPTWSWRAEVMASIPVFDWGYRAGRRAERQALFQQARVQTEATERQARADVREADENVRRSSAAFEHARAAAQQAARVVEIVNVSFRAGASTNIEVIDAQRAARDADTAAAVAEDQLRQARLALLLALGLFPG